MNSNIAHNGAYTGSSDLFDMTALLQRALDWLELQRVRRAIQKERDQLAELPEHVLQDIGVSRADALIESQRRFEDIPTGRMNCW
uniref:YjiS-like domain-containing protein n=1 Tax=uncultured Thiotrichaceae bacterium TaxID=298394 RepID=A0A6S6TYG6_9GAMM|nr:MAG: Unknown protein [uncultured Thiotrichaceae bacterium]